MSMRSHVIATSTPHANTTRQHLVRVMVGHVMLEVGFCLKRLATKPTLPVVVTQGLLVLLMHRQAV